MKLVAHWRLFYRRWSTWLSVVYATVSAILFANPTIFLGLVGFFPVAWRGFAAGALFVFLAVVPVLVVNARQKKLKEKIDASSQA